MKIRAFTGPGGISVLMALSFSAAVQAQTGTLPETVVTASRIPTRVDEQLSDVTVITRADIERSGLTSFTELLATLPGVQAFPDSVRGANPSVFMRGANNAHTLVLVDGQRVSSATTGATAIAHLPLSQVERIEVLRGPASSLYGSDAIGGVIQVFTRAGAGTPHASGSLTAGSFGTAVASVAYGGQVGDTRFSLRAGVDRTLGFSAVRPDSSGFYSAYNPDRDGYRQQNLGLSLSRRVSRDLEVGINYLYTQGRKRNDSTNCGPADYNDPNYQCTALFDNRDRQRLQSFSAYGTYRIQPGWTSTLRVGMSEDLQDYWAYDPSVPSVRVDRYRTLQPQFTWQNDIRVGPGVLMAALDWRRVNAASPVAFVVREQQTASASLGYQAWVERHLFQASVRHDDIQHLGSRSTGSVGYGYKLAQGWVVRASASTGFRAPSFNDLYWPNDPVNHYQGNPDLRPERSRNVEAGVTYERGMNRIALTTYRSRVTDLIDYPYDAATDFTNVANANAATLKGLTLSGRTQVERWIVSGSYDVLSARDDVTGLFLQRRVPRSGTLDAARTFGRLEVGVRVQAFASRFNDSYNTSRNAGYGLVSLRTAYPLSRDWTLTTSVHNALDKDYVVQRSGGNVFATAGRAVYLGLRYNGF